MKLVTYSLSKVIETEQCRRAAGVDQSVVEEYAAAYREGEPLPPIRVYCGPKKVYLGDGFHRLAALRLNGEKTAELACQYYDSDEEALREAIWLSAPANAVHGLRRTSDDLRKILGTLLSDEKWAGLSDSVISKQVKCRRSTVAEFRKSLPAPENKENSQHAPGSSWDNSQNGDKSEAGKDLGKKKVGKDGKARRERSKPAEKPEAGKGIGRPATQPLPADPPAGGLPEVVAEVMGTAEDFRAMEAHLAELQTRINRICRTAIGQSYPHKQIRERLAEIARWNHQYRPQSPCEDCDAKGCAACGDRGYYLTMHRRKSRATS